MLINDGTNLVAEIEAEIVASGGGSSRTATFAGFIRSGTVAPAESAMIRGVYVDPAYVAAGLAQRIFDVIETDIASRGYDGAHLATTYTGMPFYNAAGFRPHSLITRAFPDGREIHGVAMSKRLQKPMSAAA